MRVVVRKEVTDGILYCNICVVEVRADEAQVYKIPHNINIKTSVPFNSENPGSILEVLRSLDTPPYAARDGSEQEYWGRIKEWVEFLSDNERVLTRRMYEEEQNNLHIKIEGAKQRLKVVEVMIRAYSKPSDEGYIAEE